MNSWGARFADFLLRISRVPELHEMDARQVAIYRKGYEAGRAAARVRPPTPAEARMHLIDALEREVAHLRAGKRDAVIPEKGAL